MEDNKLKVEGLGVNTVPSVEGMNNKINVTETPTVAPVQQAPRVDVTAAPTVSQPAAAAKIDPSAIPTPTGAGKSSDVDYSLIIKIVAGVFAFAVVVILLVTMFGGKKLVCTKSEEFLGAKTETKVIVKFDGDDKVKSYRMELKEDYTNSSMYGDEDDSYFDNKLQEETKYLKVDNLKTKREGKVLYISYEYNDDKIKSYSNTKYEELKKVFEEGKYTCSNK